MPFVSLGYHFKKHILSFSKYTPYILLLGVLGWFLVWPQSCGFPKPYALGTVDARFNVTDTELRDYLAKAEAVWESALGRDIFVFDSKTGIPVNLVYDERQARTDTIETIDEKLAAIENQRYSLEEEYKKIQAVYAELGSAYESKAQQYQSEVETYNQSVAYWNTQYKIPDRVKKSLVTEGVDLETKRAELEQERINLNKVIAKLNSFADSDKHLVDTYNSVAGSFKEQYGGAVQFDRAVFTGSSINVYEFNDADVLVLALAHELGHYIGIEHTHTADSLMYYLMSEQSLVDPHLSSADKEAFVHVCDPVREGWFGGWYVARDYVQKFLGMS